MALESNIYLLNILLRETSLLNYFSASSFLIILMILIVFQIKLIYGWITNDKLLNKIDDKKDIQISENLQLRIAYQLLSVIKDLCELDEEYNYSDRFIHILSLKKKIESMCRSSNCFCRTNEYENLFYHISLPTNLSKKKKEEIFRLIILLYKILEHGSSKFGYRSWRHFSFYQFFINFIAGKPVLAYKVFNFRYAAKRKRVDINSKITMIMIEECMRYVTNNSQSFFWFNLKHSSQASVMNNLFSNIMDFKELENDYKSKIETACGIRMNFYEEIKLFLPELYTLYSLVKEFEELSARIDYDFEQLSKITKGTHDSIIYTHMHYLMYVRLSYSRAERARLSMRIKKPSYLMNKKHISLISYNWNELGVVFAISLGAQQFNRISYVSGNIEKVLGYQRSTFKDIETILPRPVKLWHSKMLKANFTSGKVFNAKGYHRLSYIGTDGYLYPCDVFIRVFCTTTGEIEALGILKKLEWEEQDRSIIMADDKGNILERSADYRELFGTEEKLHNLNPSLMNICEEISIVSRLILKGNKDIIDSRKVILNPELRRALTIFHKFYKGLKVPIKTKCSCCHQKVVSTEKIQGILTEKRRTILLNSPIETSLQCRGTRYIVKDFIIRIREYRTRKERFLFRLISFIDPNDKHFLRDEIHPYFKDNIEIPKVIEALTNGLEYEEIINNQNESQNDIFDDAIFNEDIPDISKINLDFLDSKNYLFQMWKNRNFRLNTNTNEEARKIIPETSIPKTMINKNEDIHSTVVTGAETKTKFSLRKLESIQQINRENKFNFLKSEDDRASLEDDLKPPNIFGKAKVDVNQAFRQFMYLDGIKMSTSNFDNENSKLIVDPRETGPKNKNKDGMNILASIFCKKNEQDIPKVDIVPPTTSREHLNNDILQKQQKEIEYKTESVDFNNVKEYLKYSLISKSRKDRFFMNTQTRMTLESIVSKKHKSEDIIRVQSLINVTTIAYFMMISIVIILYIYLDSILSDSSNAIIGIMSTLTKLEGNCYILSSKLEFLSNMLNGRISKDTIKSWDLLSSADLYIPVLEEIPRDIYRYNFEISRNFSQISYNFIQPSSIAYWESFDFSLSNMSYFTLGTIDTMSDLDKFDLVYYIEFLLSKYLNAYRTLIGKSPINASADVLMVNEVLQSNLHGIIVPKVQEFNSKMYDVLERITIGTKFLSYANIVITLFVSFFSVTLLVILMLYSIKRVIMFFSGLFSFMVI